MLTSFPASGAVGYIRNMRSALLFVSGCALFCGYGSAMLFAQQASIEGTVVNAATHEPLSDVHIRLTAVTFEGSPVSVYGALSDRAGHFSIASIRAGAYFPMPERSGYLFVNAKPGENPLPPLSLKPGEHRTDWVVEMVPRTILSGRVVDENGDPVQNVKVRTVAVSPESGPQVVIPVSNFGTDDRGEFRFVSGPGKFYIEAEAPGPSRSNGRPELREGGAEPVYGTSYYPAVIVKNRAIVVEVVAGKEIGGLDIHLQPLQGRAITGTVSGITQNSSATVFLQFGENAEKISGGRSASTGLEGKFSFPGVQPGFYRLYAVYGPKVSRTTELQLENGASPNVELVVMPGIDLAGTLVIEGDLPGQAMEKRRVRLEPLSAGAGYGLMPMSGGEVDGNGAFGIWNVAPAKFRVRVEPLPENGYVKIVDADGAVSSDRTIDFSTIRPAHLKVTINRNGAQITGTVLDEEGEPMVSPLAIVWLVQDPSHVQPDSTQRVMPDGKYAFHGIRPAKYRLFAANVYRMAGTDSPEILGKMAARGEEIEIKEGGRIEKNLRMLPKEYADGKPKQ